MESSLDIRYPAALLIAFTWSWDVPSGIRTPMTFRSSSCTSPSTLTVCVNGYCEDQPDAGRVIFL